MSDVTPAAAPVDPFAADVVAFGRLILAAYAMSEQGLYPPLPADFPKEYEIVQNVIMDDYGTPTFYGFIARRVQPGTNAFVLVIRGTLGTLEWLIDLQSMVPVPFYSYGSVGSGFASTYKTIYLSPPKPPSPMAQAAAPPVIKRPFAEQVAGALARHAALTGAALPAPRLSVTGHSLGAALATLYVVERLVDPQITIETFITFASPLVGDGAFKTAFDGLHLDAYRVFDNRDPVPDLPPLSGYVAVGQSRGFTLNPVYYGWDPLCSHSMDTYLNHFDPTHMAAAACTHLIPMAARALPQAPAAAVVAHHEAEMPAFAAAAASPALPPPAAIVKRGRTTITITIETDG